MHAHPAKSHRLKRAARFAILGWLGAVWFAGALYVMATFLESSRRLPRRSITQTLWWMGRETWIVLWTQPLLPVFQLAGRRMGSRSGGVPVVLVHGYAQNRLDFIYLARRLRRAGAGPLYAFNFFWPQRLEKSSRQLRWFIDAVLAATGAEAVDLLTHSTGGLFALDLIEERPRSVRKAVVIAVPARGVPWRWPVFGESGSQLRVGSAYLARRTNETGTVPVLSIYSPHDNLVHPEGTSRLQGTRVRHLRIDGPGHLSLLFDRQVGDAVVEFLVTESE